jgi:hypothetical protein
VPNTSHSIFNASPEKPYSGVFLQQAKALDFKSWQKWLDTVEGIDPQAEEEQNVLFDAIE